MGGKPWTDRELSIVLDMSLARDEAAVLVGRTPRAVVNARYKSKHGGNLMQPHHWAKNPYFVGKRTLLAKTCIACGLLIDAGFYGRDKGSWDPACAWCERDKSRRNRQGVKRPKSSKRYPPVITDWPTPRRGYLWVGRDFEVAEDQSKTIREKAKELGRTYAAVQGKCVVNGYRSMPDRHHGGRGAGQWQIKFPEEAK